MGILRAERGLVRFLLLKLWIDLGTAGQLAPVAFPAQGEFVWWFVVVAASIALSYYVFRGAKTIYSFGFALLLAFAALIPCIGLVVGLMLVIDLRDVLRQSHAEVGLLGATRKQLQAWEAQAEAESRGETA